MIEAVIFDMNGVIVDDEYIHEMAFKEVLKSYGADLTPKIYHEEYIGRTDRAIFQDAIQRFNLKNISKEKLIKEKTEKYFNLIAGNIRTYPDLLELISNLKNKFHLAISTGATKKEADMILNFFRIKRFFKVIITAEDVKNSKPNPEPYILAAKKLGIDPKKCAVIEDSRDGIIAAKKAGMFCIAVVTTHKKNELALADKVISRFDEINTIMAAGH